jgi:LacI family transcriptional regulator
MQQLLALTPRPQAVFVGNDAMAVGAYQALYQSGLRIPQDMALVGYDGSGVSCTRCCFCPGSAMR